MNVLFLTMSTSLFDVKSKGIYNDLVNKFLDEGHDMYIMAPFQRRMNKNTTFTHDEHIHTLGVRTLNVTSCGLIEKGLGQVTLEYLFASALKKYLKGVKFDLILYSTPPITFTKVIKAAKEMNPQAKTYLLLKDIFPQNAVDLGMMTKNGVKGMLYKSFRNKEKELYKVSDFIGCMSPANVKYVIDHNPEVDPKIVDIAPNSCNTTEDESQSDSARESVRVYYKLPIDKPVFIYGGNMGKPQGIPFLIECMKAVKDREDCHFVVIGGGTDYPKIQAWYNAEEPKAVSLFKSLPKADYDKLADACDIGMIFLDYRFTIPNYPSRLLSYLMNRKPIVAATDPNCDTGSLAEANGYGFYCPSNDVNAFVKAVDKILASDIRQMGENGYRFYLNNYTVQHTFDAIMKHF